MKRRIVSWLMVAALVACLPSMVLAKMSDADFMVLCKEDSLFEVQAAIEAGADVNARGEDGLTPLHVAAANPNSEVITALAKAGADVKARDEVGWNPLHFAAINNSNPEVITALLKAGADPKVKASGKLPLDYAKGNEKLKGTDAFWALNDASY